MGCVNGKGGDRSGAVKSENASQICIMSTQPSSGLAAHLQSYTKNITKQINDII